MYAGDGSCVECVQQCLPVATLEDTLHLARGLLTRVQHRLPELMQE